MKTSSLITLLKSAILKLRKVLILGQPGIGKTEIVLSVCKELNHRLIVMHPAVSDPTDFKGFPVYVPAEGIAKFVPFNDLADMINSTVPTVVLVDDLIQAPISVQCALMQLIQQRRVNGHVLADNVVFVGASNDITDQAGGNLLIEPLKSRWDTIVRLEPDFDGWRTWAEEAGMPPVLIAFLDLKRDRLNAFKPQREILKLSPNPRQWASVGRWMNEGVDALEVWAGAVGEADATALKGFVDIVKSDAPSLAECINNPHTAKVPGTHQPSVTYAVASGLSRLLDANNGKAICTYLARLPKEFELSAVRLTIKRNEDLKRQGKLPADAFISCGAYASWIVANKSLINL